MFNPVLAIWRYMINPLCTGNTPMSHHEQGEKLGHQTTCNNRIKTTLSSLKRRDTHEMNRHCSVCILAYHLEKLLVADDILHRIPDAIADQVRMANAHGEGHTSLVYSRFNDNIHTRTVSWLISSLVCLDLFVPSSNAYFLHVTFPFSSAIKETFKFTVTPSVSPCGANVSHTGTISRYKRESRKSIYSPGEVRHR